MIQLHRTPSILSKWYPSLIWSRPHSDGLLLTFDDGPHPAITLWVLEQLEKYHAKATFFCVGENIEKFGDVTKQIVSRGHLVANHTHNHLRGWKTDDTYYLENVTKCQKEIDLHQHTDINYFRPPYGRINRNQIRTLNKVYDIVMWSHLSWDFYEHLNIKRSIKGLKKAKPGSIIVFHDSEKSFKNLQRLLPELLAYWSSNHLKFSTL